MGCWNKTCGLSNLPIFAGSDVVVFPLVKASDWKDRCYSTAMWAPTVLPFYSKYNDYGGGEEDHGPGLEYIMDGIKNVLVEQEAGENEYHDIPIKKDDFNIEMFYEGVHEHRLLIQGYTGKDREVDFVMFRKDVVDDICKTYEIESYVGSGKGTCGYDNNYIKYKYEDIIAQIPAYVSYLVNKYEEDVLAHSADDQYQKVYRYLMKISHRNRDLEDVKGLDLISSYIIDNNYRYWNIVDIKEVIVDLIAAGKHNEARDMLKEHVLFVFMDQYLSSIRKIWSPGCHEGSQESDAEPYHVFIKVLDRALKNDKARWGDDEDLEEGEDDDEDETADSSSDNVA